MPLQGDANARTYDTFLLGPVDPSFAPTSGGGRRHAQAALRFERAHESGQDGIRIHLQGTSHFVAVGERSPFYSVDFALRSLPRRRVSGIVRFDVLALDPLQVLADPLQIDPRSARDPVTSPPALGGELWRRDGPFESIGWQEQTFALNDHFQTDAGFLRDMLQDLDRGAVTLLREMRRVRPGHAKPPRLVFYTFTATDRACHGFWRYRDAGHPAHDPQAALAGTDPILTVFERADAIVGRVRAALEERATLLVVSDHGFQTWRWQVCVNQWLVDNGYLVLQAEDDGRRAAGAPGYERAADAVDWGRTRAFALGLGQIYINLEGRDDTGIVPPSEKRALMEELKRRLEALTNPFLAEDDEGAGIPRRAVRSVSILEDVYTFGPGGAPSHAPDLQIGFERGYRISWQTALLGDMSRNGSVFSRNRVPWSGDHCSTDRELVPGVLFSNRRIPPAAAGRPYTVRDVAATVMQHFGLDLAPLHGESEPLPFAQE